MKLALVRCARCALELLAIALVAVDDRLSAYDRAARGIDRG